MQRIEQRELRACTCPQALATEAWLGTVVVYERDELSQVLEWIRDLGHGAYYSERTATWTTDGKNKHKFVLASCWQRDYCQRCARSHSGLVSRMVAEMKKEHRAQTGLREFGPRNIDNLLRGRFAWKYLYAKPGTYKGDWTNIDLRSAFFSIYRNLPFALYYSPGQWLLAGPRLWRDDQLQAVAGDKALRASVVGMCGSGFVDFMPRDGSPACKRPTKPANAPWTLFVLDYLQACMQDLHHTFPEIVYIHTDGAIIPTHLVEDARDLCDSWGLDMGIAAQTSKAVVKGVGVWGFDEGKATKQFEAVRGVRHTTHESRFLAAEGGEHLFTWLRDVARPALVSTIRGEQQLDTAPQSALDLLRRMM